MANNIDDIGSPYRDHILNDLAMEEQTRIDPDLVSAAKDLFGAEQKKEEKDEIQSVKDIIRDRDEYKDKWLRAVADGQNAKKHYQKESSTAFDRGKLFMTKTLLPAIDDIERCLNSVVDYKGIQLIHDKFMQILESCSFEKIDPKNGDDFDENLHNAMFIESTDKPELDGKVRSTLLAGYKMNNTEISYPIVRHAQVTIWKYFKPEEKCLQEK